MRKTFLGRRDIIFRAGVATSPHTRCSTMSQAGGPSPCMRPASVWFSSQTACAGRRCTCPGRREPPVPRWSAACRCISSGTYEVERVMALTVWVEVSRIWIERQKTDGCGPCARTRGGAAEGCRVRGSLDPRSGRAPGEALAVPEPGRERAGASTQVTFGVALQQTPASRRPATVDGFREATASGRRRRDAGQRQHQPHQFRLAGDAVLAVNLGSVAEKGEKPR